MSERAMDPFRDELRQRLGDHWRAVAFRESLIFAVLVLACYHIIVMHGKLDALIDANKPAAIESTRGGHE